MACRPLKSVNFSIFTCPSEVLKALNEELDSLAEIAKETDFNNEQDQDQFSRNILYVKMYYELYQRMIGV